MAYARNDYLGNGVNKVFTINWELGYIDPAHVTVQLDGVADTDWVLTAEFELTFTTAPGAGVEVHLRRVTPRDSALVSYIPRTVLTSVNLTLDQTQMLMLAQEDADLMEGVVDGGVVLVTGDQTVAGVKAFTDRPSCVLEPVNDEDLANRAFVWERFDLTGLGIEEAPNDNSEYTRKNRDWVEAYYLRTDTASTALAAIDFADTALVKLREKSDGSARAKLVLQKDTVAAYHYWATEGGNAVLKANPTGTDRDALVVGSWGGLEVHASTGLILDVQSSDVTAYTTVKAERDIHVGDTSGQPGLTRYYTGSGSNYIDVTAGPSGTMQVADHVGNVSMELSPTLAAKLRYANAPRMETSFEGVDITGDLTVNTRRTRLDKFVTVAAGHFDGTIGTPVLTSFGVAWVSRTAVGTYVLQLDEIFAAWTTTEHKQVHVIAHGTSLINVDVIGLAEVTSTGRVILMSRDLYNSGVLVDCDVIFEVKRRWP